MVRVEAAILGVIISLKPCPPPLPEPASCVFNWVGAGARVPHTPKSTTSPFKTEWASGSLHCMHAARTTAVPPPGNLVFSSTCQNILLSLRTVLALGCCIGQGWCVVVARSQPPSPFFDCLQRTSHTLGRLRSFVHWTPIAACSASPDMLFLLPAPLSSAVRVRKDGAVQAVPARGVLGTGRGLP